jgi:hypothetical protein
MHGMPAALGAELESAEWLAEWRKTNSPHTDAQTHRRTDAELIHPGNLRAASQAR